MLKVPVGYKRIFDIRETEIAIKAIKDFFERALANELNLTRVSAPMYVCPETGLNDNLNGYERAVGFDVPALGDNGKYIEIVHSLAKWKRLALKRYGFCAGEGLYTDMNAIRRDEELDNLHSIYVDQWDWEKIIDGSERNEQTLRSTVERIYAAFLQLRDFVNTSYPALHISLPDKIHFISSSELLEMYPDKTPKEREDLICKAYGAVFLTQIGGVLVDGKRHDGRSPDYDDWNLNGDMLFYNEVLDQAFEVMSMGIRVNAETMKAQLEIAGCLDRLKNAYHTDVINGDLPQTIGGGLGQSRICMYFLKLAHIGEVQASLWPDDMIKSCEEAGILLL